MNTAAIIDIFQRAIDRQGTNPFRCAKENGLPGNAIRHVLEGHEPKISRAATICDALGLEFYIGPPRDVAPPRPSADVIPLGSAPESAQAGLQTVSDRDLAEIIAVIADAWEAGDERTRGELLGVFNTAFKRERERERSPTRVLGWLGWRVIEGTGESGATGSRASTPGDPPP